MGVTLCNSLPYGAIILSFLYIIYSLIVVLVKPNSIVSKDDSTGDCEEGVMVDCETRTEVSDDTLVNVSVITQWSSSFFVAMITAILAFHLCAANSSKRGSLAFVIVCAGYVLKGTTELISENEELTILFLIFTLFYYLLWTVAALFLFGFIRATYMEIEHQSTCKTVSTIFLLLLAMSTVSVLMVCIWRAYLASSSRHSNSEANKDNDGDLISIELLLISQWVWSGTFCLFLSSIGWATRPILQATKQEGDAILWGLSSALAADGVILSQYLSIGFLIFYILENLEVLGTGFQSMGYLLLTFNYAMMMGFFFIHNLVFSLSRINLLDRGNGKERVTVDTDISDDEARTICGPNGAEVIFLEVPPETFSEAPAETTSEIEILPTPGPSGVKALLCMASRRHSRPKKKRPCPASVSESFSQNEHILLAPFSSSSSFSSSSTNSTPGF